ncbi:MAG: sirohydrochlorin chelatase [Planctomycetes bacterium]|nr:sirohydrochlorin chelatase [Planctomycetota bacterium]
MPDPVRNSPDGLLLVGHGTRDPQGQREFLATAAQVQARCAGLRVEPCFLELATPSIEEGIAAAYVAGVRRLTVLPLLLFAAGHAKRDIPSAVDLATIRYADLQVRYVGEALDCHPALLWLSELRYRQALCGRASVPPEKTALVMIGRGSSDAEATKSMHQFAELRSQRTPVGRLEVGFIAVQRPTLGEALQSAVAADARRIVVQPHLLFQGDLMDQVRQAAAAIASGGREIIVTAHLAPGWALARAVAVRAGSRAKATPTGPSVTTVLASGCKKE